jgi:murein DD-endopeptidase MepM/ murein hydrolase activator NlpD
MILCPVQNTATLKTVWIQSRPRITQLFGQNPDVYKQFGLAGHDGVDFGIPIGTPLFSPFEGSVKVKDSGAAGYGLHVKIRGGGKEAVLGHFSKMVVADGAYVKMGQLLGYSGNSGFSTGPHLHFGLRFIDEAPKTQPDIWRWTVLDYSNGFFGYIDPLKYMITWKGSLVFDTLDK